MPRLTLAAGLLAALSLVPARATAGPPERPSGSYTTAAPSWRGSLW
jgi:hypothetical protein